MKTTIVLILSVIAQAVGNTCLSKGMKSIATTSDMAADGFSLLMLVQAMTSPIIWIGIILLILFFAFFAAALSWADLSFVLPVTSVGYVLNVFLAHQFLNEPVSTIRWAGTILICLGVVFVSRSAGEKSSTRGEALE